MRKLLALATALLAISFMVAGAGAFAQDGDTGGHHDDGTCSDGVDNDHDDAVDQHDTECQDPNDGVEDGSDVVDTCSDGEDNDMDGAADQEDTECQDPNDGVEDGSDVVDTCSDGEDNDMDGAADQEDTECQDPNDGVEDGSDLPPAGNCASADLVLLTEDAKIICLYAPPDGTLATTEEECPDAAIASGPGPAPFDGGICVFLPPAESSMGLSLLGVTL